jgi:hypothetical protein
MVTLHDALGYHDRHEFALIPVDPKTRRPKCKWSIHQKERPSESQIRKWFGNDDQAAIAVIAGEVSGQLVCRDFDGMHVYEAWADKHRSLAMTLPTVATPRPGRHVYMRACVEQIRSIRGGSIYDFGPSNGELRGGGFTLLPPSIRRPHGVYEWLIPLADEIPTVDLEDAGLMPAMQQSELRRTECTEGHTLSTLLHGATPCLSPCNCDETPAGGPEPYSIEMAVASTLPVRAGERHRRLFDLARELKAIPELVGAGLDRLKPIVRQWHQAALPTISTKSFDDSWLDFCESWGAVKFPKGQEPIHMIVAKAIDSDLPPVAADYDSPKIKLLVRLCRELQRYHGAEPFYLDCRTAGKVLEVEHSVAWRWLRLLQHDGVLGLVSTGSQASRKANRYRYLHPLGTTEEAAT